MELKGIDVSTWQGDIDWPKVAGQGIQFAILRATFGVEGVDRKFEQNIRQAPAAGIGCGAYHYCYATSTEAARQEAEHFLEVIKPYQFPYPVALDLEDAAIAALGKGTATDIAQTFFGYGAGRRLLRRPVQQPELACQLSGYGTIVFV